MNLDTLAPGDLVTIRRRDYATTGTVERTTKTQIILTNGHRYAKTTGHRIAAPSPLSRTRIEPATR